MQNHRRIEQETALRRQALMTEAEQHRLASQRQISRGRVVRIYGPTLYRMGIWLAAWGTQLQQRYRASAPGHTLPFAPNGIDTSGR